MAQGREPLGMTGSHTAIGVGRTGFVSRGGFVGSAPYKAALTPDLLSVSPRMEPLGASSGLGRFCTSDLTTLKSIGTCLGPE